MQGGCGERRRLSRGAGGGPTRWHRRWDSVWRREKGRCHPHQGRGDSGEGDKGLWRGWERHAAEIQTPPSTADPCRPKATVPVQCPQGPRVPTRGFPCPPRDTYGPQPPPRGQLFLF